MNKQLVALKDFVKHNSPLLFSRAKAVQIRISEILPAGYVFGRIHRNRGWDNLESLSGPGSTLEQTEELRKELPRLIKHLGVRSLIDAPCGDFRWMSAMEKIVESYLGVDVVPAIIERNQLEHTGEGRRFVVLDITKSILPKTDLILCRDCLFHFSNRMIAAALRNFAASKSEYLLTTTFPDLDENMNIPSGGWRPLNLQRPPFAFPTPISMIHEHFTDVRGKLNTEKSLGLWRIKDIVSAIAALKKQ